MPSTDAPARTVSPEQTVGIGFHEATLFGLFNQLLLTLLALGIIVLIVAGYMAWWRRRPQGSFAAPPKPGPLLRTTPIPLLLAFAVSLWLLPLLGISFIIYLVLERVFWFVRTAGFIGGSAGGAG